MPKQKTHKGLTKRVKVTGRGKVKRHRAFRGHFLSSRSAKRRRRLRQTVLLMPADARRAKEAMGE